MGLRRIISYYFWTNAFGAKITDFQSPVDLSLIITLLLSELIYS